VIREHDIQTEDVLHRLAVLRRPSL